MSRHLLLSVLVLALAACNPEPPAPSPVPEAALPPLDQPDQGVPPASAPVPAAGKAGLARFDGYGDMRFGMSEAEARAAWGGELVGDDGEGCHYLHPAWEHVPAYFAFMFEGGRFVRYDVGNDGEVAPGGGRRGMDADAIRSLYAGRVEESLHKYVEGGSYLEVAAGDGSPGKLVFETDAEGTVGAWRAGVDPQVGYVEGCS